jgi:hypothetical protein
MGSSAPGAVSSAKEASGRQRMTRRKSRVSAVRFTIG